MNRMEWEISIRWIVKLLRYIWNNITLGLYNFNCVQQSKNTVKPVEGGRPRVMDITPEINDMFVSYLISPKPIKL